MVPFRFRLHLPLAIRSADCSIIRSLHAHRHFWERMIPLKSSSASATVSTSSAMFVGADSCRRRSVRRFSAPFPKMLPTALLLCASIVFMTNPSVDAEISIKIERHFPCSAASGPKKENLIIKFPSYKSTGVAFKEEKDDAGHKCFQMGGGKVEVYAPGLDGNKKYYVHVETRIGIHGKPERCVNPDKEGCGGIGSCVHCDICQTIGGFRQFIQIFKGDKPAECSAKGLPPGTYDNLSLKVCLPSKDELLPFLDQNSSRAEQLWDVFVSSRARSGGEIPLVIAARIFDRPINKLSIKELNDALHNTKKGMIGCHWIYATVRSINQD
ncbi:hypothetical protein niasHS_002388 [Heterodera schachtii]